MWVIITSFIVVYGVVLFVLVVMCLYFPFQIVISGQKGVVFLASNSNFNMLRFFHPTFVQN